jgi:putative RNA 2'-phosphotransferase
MKKLDVRISKFLSFILRHHPDKFNLKLDNNGYADIKTVLKILSTRFKNEKISKETIELIIQNSKKTRFEIIEDKIRAFYGHSIDKKIDFKENSAVPSKLYHGTTKKACKKILQEGITKQNRQYVHLTENVRDAVLVGKRRTEIPIILEIDVIKAQENGIQFYKSGDMFLADYIPPEYIHRIMLNGDAS